MIGNVGAITQYRSPADGNTFPGYQKAWIDALGPSVTRNFVLELKSYGGPVGTQTFTVDGVRYSVPAPDMTIQRRSSTPTTSSARPRARRPARGRRPTRRAVADLPAAWQAKPVTTAEWGTAKALGDQAAWIRTVPAALTRLNAEPGPRVAVANYVNSDPARATLDPKAAGLTGLHDAYSTAPFK